VRRIRSLDDKGSLLLLLLLILIVEVVGFEEEDESIDWGMPLLD
jgi:hypothetical protein